MPKNDLYNKFPEWIHGVSTQHEEDKFIMHNRYPRFLARVSFNDKYEHQHKIDELSTLPRVSKFSEISPKNLKFISDIGISFSNFIIIDRGVSPNDKEYLKELSEACARGVEDIIKLTLNSEQ